jgi:hypothetical protein
LQLLLCIRQIGKPVHIKAIVPQPRPRRQFIRKYTNIAMFPYLFGHEWAFSAYAAGLKGTISEQ